MLRLYLYARVRLLLFFCTRDRGCSKHPAFPAPSFLWAKRFARPGRNAPRECGGVFVREPSLRGANGSRECAPDDRLRDEAIHAFFTRRDGLLRFARNDGVASFRGGSQSRARNLEIP